VPGRITASTQDRHVLALQMQGVGTPEERRISHWLNGIFWISGQLLDTYINIVLNILLQQFQSN